MRWYRAKDGSRQLYITDAAIEEIADSELERAGLMSTPDRPVVDIEGFIERHLDAQLDAGADLEPGVLGLTELRPGARPRILVNRNLTDSAVDTVPESGLLGRWRATLAHEAAHVLLHGFVLETNPDQTTLFAAPPDDDVRLFRCYSAEVVVTSRRQQDPREVQANKGMAALLMPRRVFGALARDGASTMTEYQLTATLARAFEVSRQASRIRLSTLGFLNADGAYVAPILG